MITSTSSSHERGRAREKVEANRRRSVGRRSSSRGASSCSSSEDERNEKRSRGVRRDGVKDYGRPYRERRSSSSHDRSRRRKRSPSPSPSTSPSRSRSRRKKIRSTSDSDSPRSRSRTSHFHSHSQCKYSSFHKRHWHRSGVSRHGKCCCFSYYYTERENRVCSKRKERSSSPVRSEGGQHNRSRSRGSMSHGSNRKSPQNSKVRKQCSCDVHYSQENAYLGTDSDSPRKDSFSGNSARTGKVLTKEKAQLEHKSKLQFVKSRKHSPPSFLLPDPDLKEKLKSSGGLTDELLDQLGVLVQPSQRVENGKDQLVYSGNFATDGKGINDFLDVSLKGPGKPTPKIVGISREDLKLSLHSTMPPAVTVPDDLEEGEIRVNLEDNAFSTSSYKGGFEASLCSTSSFCSVHAEVPMFKVSPSGRNNRYGAAGLGDITMQEEATSSLHNTKKSRPSDPVVASSGSPLQNGHRTKEERCLDLLNQLISMSKENKEMVANLSTHLPVSGSKQEQPAVLTVTDKQEILTANDINGSTRADISVSVIELSNSLSAEQNDLERAELSGDNKEVNSRECFALVKAKMEASTRRDASAAPVDPSPLSQTPTQCKPLKATLFSQCSVVELSDSTTMQEDDDEEASEVQSQPLLELPVFELNETPDKSDPHLSSDLKDLPPVQAGRSQDGSTDPTSNPVVFDATAERTEKGLVHDFSDLDHATDLFIEKVHSLLINSRPRSSPVPSRLKHSFSSAKESVTQEAGSKHKSRINDSSTSRRETVEVVEISDSSSPSSSECGKKVALVTKRVNSIPAITLKSVEPHTKTQESAEIIHDHSVQYLNEDVVCCSTKPPLRRDKDAYGGDQPSRVTYIRDKHGNLIQVVDVGDSDIGEDGEEHDTKSSGEDKDDEFFSSHPQVLPVIQEIKEMLLGKASNIEKSSEQDDPTSPAPKVRPLERNQIPSRTPSLRLRSRRLVLEESESQDSEADTEAVVGSTGITSTVGKKQREKWKRGIVCDLCSGGPSLALGEWYCWCCGMPATICECAEDKKMRKQLSLGYRKGQKQKKRGKQILSYQWSGKVHRMCALWSSEVYVKSTPKKEPYFAQLETAVKRGNTLVCKHPDCKKTGATLGCRVRACRRSYHYPCAEKLANQCMVRMWDGALVPIACQYHRHVEEQAERARDRLLRSKITDPVREGKTVVPAERPYIGVKLLCEDIAEGQEQVQIPCTNDVDDDPAPNIRYITKCWLKGRPVDHLHPVGTELARGCQGCAGPNFDNPHSLMPPHVMGADRSRESDDRLDWQGERMYGRLPYNAAGLLQLGPDSKDIIECNSRCKCGPKCKNRELQKGLRCSLELFKTKDRGWGVRALEQIPRGKFVVEYVGDVLTQAEADERGEKYDQNQLSYLFNLDHPGLEHSDAIVLDGITMSNIARFINHSCEGNLMIFRVFTETTDLRYFRIGMYAIQDIEVGDELSYDYNYASSKGSSELVDDPTAIRCFCGAQTCRKWLWQGGDSGLKH